MKKIASATHYEWLADDPLLDFYVPWDIAKQSEVNDYFSVLVQAKTERTMQAFLTQHRHFLTEHLRGGHGRWVIPQKRLGAEHVPDFLIGERHSFGFDWHAVELESPRATAFTKAGDQSAALTHAIRQIMDWREWLTNNIDYARRLEIQDGLGLTKIRPDLDGLIIIGRRNQFSRMTDHLREQLKTRMGITVHSYEYLMDSAYAKAEHFKQ